MVMPLYDEGPQGRSRRPYATYALLFINIGIFVYQLTLGDAAAAVFVTTLGFIPALLSGDASGTMPVGLTLITYQFLHGDLFHVIANMLFLWVFGDNIEDAMGPVRFLAFYLLCGVGAALGHWAADPHSVALLIGASGSVSGVVMAYLLVRPCAKVTVLLVYRPVRLSAYWVIGAFVVMQVLNLTFSRGDNVAYWAHLAGLVTGAVLFPFMRYRHVALLQCIEHPDEPHVADAPRA